MKKRIGDILMEMGFIDEDQLKMALMESQKTGGMLGDVLRRLDWVTEEDLQMAIAVQSGRQILDTQHLQADPEVPPSPLEAKNVLILHAHEANAPVFVQTDQGIARVLQRAGIPILNQYFVYLDLRRNPGPEYRRLLVDEMRVRFSRHKFDAIVTMFPEALEFVLEECQDIFPDLPVLALYLPEGFTLPKTDRPMRTERSPP